MTAFVDWNLHQTGLPDLRQAVPRRMTHKRDVPLAPQHLDELLKQSPLLGAPCRAVLKRFDENAGVVGQRIGELQLRMGHGRTCEWRS